MGPSTGPGEETGATAAVNAPQETAPAVEPVEGTPISELTATGGSASASAAEEDLHKTELELLLEKHGKKIALGVALVLIAGLGYVFWQGQQRAKKQSAITTFADAAAVAQPPADAMMGQPGGLSGREDQLIALVEEYKGKMPAGHALIRLAGIYRDRGDLEAAIGRLRQFQREYPDHPFAGQAGYTLGMLLENQGDREAALSELERVIKDYPDSFAAPVALEAKGDLLLEAGQAHQALELYQQVEDMLGEGVAGRQLTQKINLARRHGEPLGFVPESLPDATAMVEIEGVDLKLPGLENPQPEQESLPGSGLSPEMMRNLDSLDLDGTIQITEPTTIGGGDSEEDDDTGLTLPGTEGGDS